MHFRLIEATTEEQIAAMIPSFWAAFHDPRHKGMELTYPIKGTGPQAIKEAMEDCKKRMIAAWKNNTTGHYLQVLNSNDIVIGATLWNIYDEENNPYLRAPPREVKVDWWPEGSAIQKFTKMAMGQALPLKFERQKRPHLALNMCYTDPGYRRHGVAGMMMNWGTNKADELGVECFLASSDIAIPTYQHSKFLVIDRTDEDMTIPNPSDEWKKLVEWHCPFWWTNMWRPIKGEYKEGEKYPWEK